MGRLIAVGTYGGESEESQESQQFFPSLTRLQPSNNLGRAGQSHVFPTRVSAYHPLTCVRPRPIPARFGMRRGVVGLFRI